MTSIRESLWLVVVETAVGALFLQCLAGLLGAPS